jgi:Ni,Fe-hydrogenase III small subunit
VERLFPGSVSTTTFRDTLLSCPDAEVFPVACAVKLPSCPPRPAVMLSICVAVSG